MRVIDPTRMADRITSRYLSYLRSTFHFRDPDFRESFEQALESGKLAKGPFLEVAPGFAEGAMTPELLTDLLGQDFDQSLANALGENRRLYAHQDQAIRMVDNGRNVVVATGTGSGKTEAFLIPILTHLYREHVAGTLGPGVRALVLYPLNALANDQRRRLGEASQALVDSGSSFRFTFGRYVGETPEKSAGRDSRPLSGELTTREQMRQTPPHILLTNYSMLEYLLLRPWDSKLFDDGRGATWTFLVLDEAHQYRGSGGAEMAMLVRRLKQRVEEGGCQQPLRCIATSATLARGGEDAPAIAEFAERLFGAPFDETAVVLAKRASPIKGSNTQLTVEDYDALSKVVDASHADVLACVANIGRRLGANTAPFDDARALLGSLLLRDQRVRRLMDAVADHAVELQSLGDNLFSECDRGSRIERLAALVDLLIQARDPNTGAPIVSARYHLMLRALDGLYLSYVPEKRVHLERRFVDAGLGFETGLCRECGQHYLLGQRTALRDERLNEPDRDLASERFGIRYLRPLDERDTESEAADGEVQLRSLCVTCGRLGQHVPDCDHGRSIRVAVEPPPKNPDRRDRITRCGRCEYFGTDPVREAVHGADGPNVVIATALFDELPEHRRKVLAFRDGRQEAAFFAWYAERTHRQFVRRALLLKVVRRMAADSDGLLSLEDVSLGLRVALRDAGELASSVGQIASLHESWLDVYREFLTDQRRISLEGVGLVGWEILWPSWHKRALRLLCERLSLNECEARDLGFLLLDTLRARGAVELRTPMQIPPLNWTELGLRNQQTITRIGQPRSDRTVVSWDGEKTNRAALLGRVLRERGVSPSSSNDQAVKLLREFWELLIDDDQRAPNSDEQLLLRAGDGWRLNPDWWRVRPQNSGAPQCQCTACGRQSARNVAGICPRYRCPGKLGRASIDGSTADHYRSLYEQSLRTFRAEEHTAQLVTKRAQEVQQDFERGSVNLLSCSTTFELGVDLGDLDVVFLRNVPPEPFNYVQRIGRAGRRERPGFAVTYCRRTPHDLYHFNEPDWMLRGLTRPPALSLQNEKIVRRHMVAVAIAAFVRDQDHRFGDVKDLLRDVYTPTLASDVLGFLRATESRLRRHLKQIVPKELHVQLGLCDGSWIDQVAGAESRLAEVESETRADCAALRQLESDSIKTRDYRAADWAQRRAKTLMSERALTYLSRKVAIPKYGFPVEVVELDLQRNSQSREASNVILQRDLSLAVSEYAPTAEVVAAKKLWQSYALKLVPGRAWPRRQYRRCPQHHTFVQWVASPDEKRLPCGCEQSIRTYVEPRFGFITSRTSRAVEPHGAPQRLFATRPFFAGLDREPTPFLVHGILEVRPACPGTMVTLCDGRFGRGFFLCEECGAGFRTRKRSHRTPFGKACDGRLQVRALGHEFTTDIAQIDFLVTRRMPVDVDGLWFAYSVAYAVAQGAAHTLDVPATDLSATVRRRPNTGDYTLVLYDNVPGGAGLVARLSEIPLLTEALRAASHRVSGNCGCSETTSCYGCLRSFSNQFAHPNLQRGPVAAYLTEVLEKLLT